MGNKIRPTRRGSVGRIRCSQLERGPVVVRRSLSLSLFGGARTPAAWEPPSGGHGGSRAGGRYSPSLASVGPVTMPPLAGG